MSRTSRSNSNTGCAWREAPVSMFAATFAGVGHLPGGPGTYAAVLVTPLVVWMSGWPLLMRFALFTATTCAAMYVSGRAGRALREHDSNLIVIDEVIGVWATLVWFDELGWLAALVGLVVFRILDTKKPPGAAMLDEEGNDGVAVVGDDLVAALWSVPAVMLVRWLVN